MRFFVLFLGLVCCAAAQRTKPAPDDVANLNAALVRLTDRLTPAVVQVSTDTYAPVRPVPGAPAALRQSAGSGVIISEEGHIVTNAHVVSGSGKLTVTLPPTRSEEFKSIVRPKGRSVPAKLVGVDRETDLAVLKVDAGKLPMLQLADSEQVKQGQIVLALGNPLGFDNSVSMGVVSAVARQIAPDDAMIYIQTDASINPGNSGGPMVDVNGAVIGINALIFSQSGGSEGLGFAVPSNIVKHVFDQLVRSGSVTRGEIGIEAQTITPGLASGLGLEQSSGVVLSDVTPRGPASVSGLQIGDVVLSLNGKPMENARQLQVNLYSQPIRSIVMLEIMRGKEKKSVQVAVLERRDDPGRFASLVDQNVNAVPQLGVLALNLDLGLQALLPSVRNSSGVLVASALANATGPAGIFAPGDVIYAVNTTKTGDLDQLRAALSGINAGSSVVIQAERGGRLRYLEVTVD